MDKSGIIAVLALLMECAVQQLFWRKEDKKLSIGVQTAYFAVLLLPAISLLLPHFSLPLFLCAYLSACVLQQRISSLPNGKLGDYGTIRFLTVGSVTLFIMGAASLIQHDVHKVCSNLISVILFICYSFSLIRIFHTESVERFHLALNHSLKQTYACSSCALLPATTS